MKLALKPENIAQLVFFVRGEKVMFDADLAKLYSVTTKALNQAFRRNRERFPEDFVYQLTGIRSFEVTICNLKSERGSSASTSDELVTVCDQFTEASRRTLSPLCLYRTGRCDAFQCLAF